MPGGDTLTAAIDDSPQRLDVSEMLNQRYARPSFRLAVLCLVAATFGVSAAQAPSARPYFPPQGAWRKQEPAAVGFDKARLAEAIAADDVANGRLRRVLPQWQATPIAAYAITETRLLPAKTQRFIEFLRERLGQP